MIYALDTNIISYILRNAKGVKQRWKEEEEHGNPSVIPLVAYYEVKRGLIDANATEKLGALEQVCKTVKVEGLTIQDAHTASRIYAELKKQRSLIDDADILIAAQALTRGHILVTNNVKHFERVDGLQFVNWAE